MTPLCARICPCPFFEATTPGAAPGPPVKTGARVRRFRGCNNQPRTPRHSSCRDCPPSSIVSAVAYETKPLELPVARAAFGRVRGPPARSRADGGLPAAACHRTTSTQSGPRRPLLVAIGPERAVQSPFKAFVRTLYRASQVLAFGHTKQNSITPPSPRTVLKLRKADVFY